MDFDALLGQIETSRPDLADSLSLIRQFQHEKKGNNSDTDDNDKVQELVTLIEKQKRINVNLLQQFNRLENNYKILIRQSDQFAEAVGACPECWGEDINCNYCRGRGKPGHLDPNQEYFDVYIKPVIIRLKNNKSQTLNSNNHG